VAAEAPPFRITPRTLRLAGELERAIGRAEAAAPPAAQPLLRKQNRVRTVRASVGIEGNTLTEDQVTAILEGKRVVGTRREILEVTNANAAYDQALTWRATRERDFLAAHAVMMTGLTEPAGRYRRTNVGVLDGSRVAHVAPQPPRVPPLVRSLLAWLAETETPLLVASCVVHYELLFIHPFTDGNGRMARLWQHVVLLAVSPVFQVVPVESVIRARQRRYYEVLRRCDRRGDSTEFVELVLEALRDAMIETAAALLPARSTSTDRLAAARAHFRRRWFRRGDYVVLHRSISTATASRDLSGAVAGGLLVSRGERRMTEYRFR
jgi:Fic family protein